MPPLPAPLPNWLPWFIATIKKKVHLRKHSSRTDHLLFLFFFRNSRSYLLIDWLIAVLGLRFCARAFSSCGKWGPLFIALRGPLTIAASLVAEHRLQTRMLSNLWLTGPVAPRHAGSSQTRARTRVPCIGRQTLNHCATREAPDHLLVSQTCQIFPMSKPSFHLLQSPQYNPGSDTSTSFSPSLRVLLPWRGLSWPLDVKPSLTPFSLVAPISFPPKYQPTFRKIHSRVNLLA